MGLLYTDGHVRIVPCHPKCSNFRWYIGISVNPIGRLLAKLDMCVIHEILHVNTCTCKSCVQVLTYIVEYFAFFVVPIIYNV